MDAVPDWKIFHVIFLVMWVGPVASGNVVFVCESIIFCFLGKPY